MNEWMSAEAIYGVMHWTVGWKDQKSMWHIKPFTLQQV